MSFYDRRWELIGTGDELAEHIKQMTGIDKKYLHGPSNLSEASIATKFSWMAGRVTGEIEDIAYSMIGLFDINMPLMYSEGRRAFMRLQQILIEKIPDESLFAWSIPKEGLQCFRRGDSQDSDLTR
jgi:hypothetical protein